jgi:hypothetical protein
MQQPTLSALLGWERYEAMITAVRDPRRSHWRLLQASVRASCPHLEFDNGSVGDGHNLIQASAVVGLGHL